jgi:hypothetical protein
MRELLRAGMTRDEFFFVLDQLAEDGLSFTLPGGADPNVISIPVADGGTLLCFVQQVLTYVEHDGGVFLELAR